MSLLGFTRRTAAALLMLGGLGLAGDALSAETFTVTDLAGREVEIPKGAHKIILGEGRMFYATVVLDKDKPFEQLAAIGDDLGKFGRFGRGAAEGILQQRMHFVGTLDQRHPRPGRRQQEGVAAKAGGGVDDRGNAAASDPGGPNQRMAALAAAPEAIADGAAGKIDTRLVGGHGRP